MPNHVAAPGVFRRRLAGALKDARIAAGKSEVEAAKYLERNKAKITRLESDGRIRRIELDALLKFYAVSDEDIGNKFLPLYHHSHDESPYAAYTGDADESYLLYLQYELSADQILNFEPLLVPGLLQTEAYAKSVVEMVERSKSETVDILVDLRIQRQELVSGREHGPERHFIMDEAVIHRRVGNAQVMKEQLAQLRQFATDDSAVTVQIVPFETGLYQHFRIPYVLLQVPELEHEGREEGHRERFLYIEDPLGQFMIYEEGHGGKNVRRPPYEQSVEEYREMFYDLGEKRAMSKMDTIRLLDTALRELATI